jgi:hypothetical protein
MNTHDSAATSMNKINAQSETGRVVPLAGLLRLPHTHHDIWKHHD